MRKALEYLVMMLLVAILGYVIHGITYIWGWYRWVSPAVSSIGQDLERNSS